MIQRGRRRGRLPLHPRPLPHEALSSWLDRLAEVYGLQRKGFLRIAFGIDPVPDGGELDINGGISGLATGLAERTGVTPERIRAMTLAGYVPGLLTTAEPQLGLFDAYARQFGWFVPPGRRDGDKLVEAVPWMPWRADDLLSPLPRCCPRCLLADPVPYVRLHWRLAWMASCPRHGEMLVPLLMPSTMVHVLRDRAPRRAAADLLALDRVTLSAATTGTALLPRGGGPVPGAAWLRALRTLLDELIRPMAWFTGQGRDEVTMAWLRTGGMYSARHGWQAATFERMPPE